MFDKPLRLIENESSTNANVWRVEPFSSESEVNMIGFDDGKTAYVCGPLTDLLPEDHERIKGFYSRIADHCKEITGLRGFAPHEHFDPVKFAQFTPEEVDRAERDQVCSKTSVVIAVYLAPSWGSGIEVEMANQSGVPVIVVCPMGKKASRLLLGNPAVRRGKVLYYESEDHALYLIGKAIAEVMAGA